MKKQPKRLILSRESLHLLDGDKLNQVNGGIVTPSIRAGNDCSVNVCPTLTCHYTTCY